MTATRAALLAVLFVTLPPAGVAAQHADPCSLLSASEIQAAFPGATAGVRDSALEQYGIARCSWNYPDGGLLVLLASDGDESAREGAEGLTPTFLDPWRSDASKRVRYEPLPGVGDHAVAVLEREDKTKGFMRDGAILVVQRGRHQVSVLSSDLARRERAAALRVFKDLGKAIAIRLH